MLLVRGYAEELVKWKHPIEKPQKHPVETVGQEADFRPSLLSDVPIPKKNSALTRKPIRTPTNNGENNSLKHTLFFLDLQERRTSWNYA